MAEDRMDGIDCSLPRMPGTQGGSKFTALYASWHREGVSILPCMPRGTGRE